MDKQLVKQVLEFVCDKSYAGHSWGGAPGCPVSRWLSPHGNSDYSQTIEEVAEEFDKEQFFKKARQ